VDFAQHLLDQLSASAFAKPVPTPETGQPLTECEFEVLALIVEGANNQAIAKLLVIGEHTVYVDISNIFAKLHVTLWTEVAALALKLHLV
jgi:DNA-binding NarL/FixJ family response regulator